VMSRLLSVTSVRYSATSGMWSPLVGSNNHLGL